MKTAEMLKEKEKLFDRVASETKSGRMMTKKKKEERKERQSKSLCESEGKKQSEEKTDR